jgi:glutamyl-tRNA(Gln) amidotransferase subunit E
VDNHRNLPRLVHIEAFRQLNLLRVRAELQRRGVRSESLELTETGLPWEVSGYVFDATTALRRCDYRPISDAIECGDKIIAVRIPGFDGLLTHSTQPGVTFARELADRVRVIACPLHRPFMIHSEIRDYGLDPRQWRILRQHLKAESGDAMVLVWAPEQDVATAVREIFIRAQEAVVGVPAETRQAFRDGTNGFERILPGPDRMYPDTDTPPLPIADSLVVEIRENLPETPWAREGRYENLGLEPPAARRLARAPWADLFDALQPDGEVLARRLAAALEKRLPYHRRLAGAEVLPSPERIEPMVRAVRVGEVRVEAMERILDALIENAGVPAEAILAPYKCQPGDMEELAQVLEEVTTQADDLADRSEPVRLRWGMGRVMPRFIGRLDPGVVHQELREALQTVGELGR